MADEKLAIYCAVTAQNGARTPISIDTDLTPTQLRKEVSDATKIPLDTLRLIFRGRMIQDNDESKVVDEYKLDKECVLHCMGAPAASGASASTSAPPSAAAAVPMSTTAGSSVSVPAASAPTAPPLTSTATATDPLKTALDTIRSNNPPATYLTAVQTLEKALTNIMTHPLEEKYRKVKQQNPAFRKRLGGLIGGDAAMLAAGFLTEMSNGEQVYMMHASPQAWPKLVASKTTIETAIQQARAGAAPPVMPMGGAAGGMAMPGMGGMAAPGGMPGMEGMGMPGGAAGMNPSMQNAMADMMSNPEALQSMLQNPMVMQMIQNDPNVSPMLRQSIQQLSSNPAMLNQLATMMADPNARSQIQNMMANGGGGGAGGGMPGMGGGMPGMPGMPGMGGMPGMNNQQQQQQQQSPNGGGPAPSDDSQTEDEMIAEAIRRSLEEG